jgi:hypothetical protein
MKIRLDHHPNYENKKCSKPPTRLHINDFSYIFLPLHLHLSLLTW